MLNDLHFPEQLTGRELDAYLNKGWYRLGQIIFTTDYVPYLHHWYRVFWLRFKLSTVKYGKKQLKLLKLNQRFSIQLKPLEITDEVETLYQLYKSKIDFESSPTVKNYLFDGGIADAPLRNVFPTAMFEVRDGEKLIAVGIFDNGEECLAGILNFYDPDYRKYSLGKFLMLLKINQATEAGKTWYYPGYIAYEYTKFDYKLFPDPTAAEIFDPLREEWLPYSADLVAELARQSGNHQEPVSGE